MSDLVASVVRDVDVKLRAQAEIEKRIASSTATMRVLVEDHGLTYPDLEQLILDGLVAKGYERTVQAGVGRERIRKLVKGR